MSHFPPSSPSTPHFSPRLGDRDQKVDRIVDGAIVVGLLVAAFVVRRLALPAGGLPFDDSWVVTGATKAEPSQLLDVATNHPGFTAILMAWARTISERSDLFAWLPFVIGVVTPAAFFAVATRSLGIHRFIAGAGGLLLAVAPAHAVYSGRVKPYVIGTLITILLAAIVPHLALRRWSWVTAAAWVAATLVVGSIEALTLVITAVAMLILVAHPAGDRTVRIVALVAQGALQVALLVTVQGRFASGTVAEEWETTYDGYLELDRGPVSFIRQGAAHTARLGQEVVEGPKLLGAALVVLAVVGLGWRACRGSQRIAARFLLALFLVSFVGGIVRQIPYGPAVGNESFPGGRANLWMLPSLFFGLAWAVDGVRRRVARSHPTVATSLAAAVLVAATVIFVVHAGDVRRSALGGVAPAALELRSLADDDTLVVVLPNGEMALAAEPGVPARIAADRQSHQGFDVAWTDPHWDGMAMYGAADQFDRALDQHDRVVIFDGFVGFGDDVVPDLERAIEERGYRQVARHPHGIAAISVWEKP